MKDVKIVIGANYGDEGKGMMTRYFAVDANRQNKNPIVVFHNGSAQRGHTVDYRPGCRHIFHHFGSGTGDGVPTFFAETFWVHPMEFAREYAELVQDGIYPQTYCDPRARVITPFDMLVDHATEAWIALQRGEREYGSCGYGTWCAIESRGYHAVYSVASYFGASEELLRYELEDTWNSCLAVLIRRGVDVEKLPEYKDYFIPNSWKKENLIKHFISDLKFFLTHTTITPFNSIGENFGSFIFENSQGLGLDKDVDNEWHTTSKTGIINPYNILSNTDLEFKAEVCYVSRSYATRHGVGPMDNETAKSTINEDMVDMTNVPNEFQGTLRYGYPEEKEMLQRIDKDFAAVAGDNKFSRTIAITHCNEFPNNIKDAIYESYNPYSVLKK